MLDSWIIEELKRREERDSDARRPVIELPLGDPLEAPSGSDDDDARDDDKVERGVVIIDL